MSEPHDVVKLLVKRMESHPQEFMRGAAEFNARWYDYVEGINVYGNEADKAVLNAKLRDIRMAEIHECVMDELCNGPERRRKQEEKLEYERNLAQSLQHTKQQQNAIMRIDSSGNIGVGNITPSISLDVANGGTGATLNEGLLKNIKKALNL